MASHAQRYQAEIHDRLGFFATWLPGDPIDIGDVGVLRSGRFRRTTSLSQLGVAYSVGAAGAAQDLQYTSTNGTSVALAAGADATVAEAEIRVAFSDAGSFVFHVSGLRLQRIEDSAAVGAELLRLHEAGDWDRDWLLVETLHTAKRATILVCEDASGEVVLTAKTAGLKPLASLADPEIDLTVASARGSIVQLVARNDLRPLYSCLRVKDPILRAASIQPVRGPDDLSPEDLFVRPAIEELLES
jgi:hypothetical protein